MARVLEIFYFFCTTIYLATSVMPASTFLSASIFAFMALLVLNASMRLHSNKVKMNHIYFNLHTPLKVTLDVLNLLESIPLKNT